MEEVVVPALSSSSVFNSKQLQLQQHDLLLVQQRQQLEQLKKEQEELKSRLRRYGKVTNTQSAQQSTQYAPVTQPAPHQPVATLTKMISSNVRTNRVKRKETKIPHTAVDIPRDENHKSTDEVNTCGAESASRLSNASNDDDTRNGDPPITLTTESASSVGEDGQEAAAIASQTSLHSRYNDERPIKPLQGSNYEEVLDQQGTQFEDVSEKSVSSHNTQVKKTYLRKGEGIARFGMKKLQLKKKSLQRASSTVKDNEMASSIGSENVNHTILYSTSAPVVSAVDSKVIQINHQSSIHLQGHHLLSRFPSDDSFVVRQQNHCKKEVEDLEEFEMLEKAAENMSFSSQNSLVLRVIGKPVQIQKRSATMPEQADLLESSEDSELSSEDEQSADETLRATTPPVVFDDEEAWESCSRSSLGDASDTNSLTSSVEELGHPLVASTPPVKEKLITNKSENSANMQPLLNEPVKLLKPNMPAKVTAGQEVQEAKVVIARPTAAELSQKPTIVLPSLPSPPTSNLVKKLFPLLDTEKHVTAISTSNVKKEESPKTISLKEELETKRCQLEIEIDRFKRENAAISKVRLEREENLRKLREEISDFQRQRAEEMEQFEDYKKEEIKKLKKERKVFETYQKQLLARPNRKERQEIEALRDELRQTQEEIKTKESRWGASLARYRLKIETLETQNKELQNDLHMMEQERLKQWQLQFNERKKVSSKGCQVELLANSKLQNISVSSIACQVDLQPSHLDINDRQVNLQPSNLDINDRQVNLQLPHLDINDPTTSSVTSNKPFQTQTTSFSETNSVDSSLISEDEDIITIVTNDRVTASVLHADTDISSISADHEEQIVTPLCSPSRSDNSKQTVDHNIVTARNSTSAQPEVRTADGSNKKSVRFQDSSCDHNVKLLCSNSAGIAPDKAVVIDEDGSQVIRFPNGTKKVINTDGSVSMYFFNGDSKQIKPDNTVIYYYAESNTTHTTFPDGLEMFHFTNNQVEKHYPDGHKEVTFSDGTVKYLHPSGVEECYFEDGTIQKVQPNGDHTIEFPNGQKEIHTKKFKSREYPDGTVKTVYPDGRQETRYSSGRIRIKDKNGNLIVDKIEATT